MINQKTTLILGAGASQEFGYPTGEGLYNKICEITQKKTTEYNTLLDLTKTPYDIEEFGEALLNSGLYSVDEFLQSRKQFNYIGKCAIALALIPYEDKDKLTKGGSNNWYKHLFTEMKKDCDETNFEKNKVSFITFNYDRSLEQFLFTSFKHSFSEMNDNKCSELLKKFKIIHLHGKLGHLPFENPTEPSEFSYFKNDSNNFDKDGRYYRAYESNVDYGIIKGSIMDLKIIHDEHNKREYEKAIKLMNESKRIFGEVLNYL
jgi:hypothetical protein